METRVFQDAAAEAAEIIKNGGLVAVPTETVYGLACSGLDDAAVRRVYEVKGRPAIKPLSLMITGGEAMDEYCVDVPEQARALAKRFWPGPLTIILRSKPVIPAIVLAGGHTVGLRCPQHPMTLELLRRAGLPFAAPSANPSGQESPKTAEQVLRYFSGSIEAVIDGGECGIGRESTIIDMSAVPYKILRQGALYGETVADALADGLKIVGVTGGTGCGKTTALRELEGLGAMVIDCDRVYHELLGSDAKLLRELEDGFPGVVVGGALDRKALGARVFSDGDALSRLNEITHRHIMLEVRRRLRDHAMSGGRVAAIDAIELISSGLGRSCTATVAVLASRERRVARIMTRDGISREYACLRIDAQRPDQYYRDNCGYVLYNDDGEEQFKLECITLFKEILKDG